MFNGSDNIEEIAFLDKALYNTLHIKGVCKEGKCVISDFNVDPTAFYNIYKTRDTPENIKSLLCEGNESGEGVMQCFEIAPGIQITYNDLNMDSCFRPLRFEKNFLQITTVIGRVLRM